MESIYQKLKTNRTFYFIKKQKKRLNEQLKKPKESLKKNLAKDCKSNPRAFYGY